MQDENFNACAEAAELPRTAAAAPEPLGVVVAAVVGSKLATEGAFDPPQPAARNSRPQLRRRLQRYATG